MKKLMYLGFWLSIILMSNQSCVENEPFQEDEILAGKIIYTTDTIVILDPEIGNEIKKVIEKTDTLWVVQNEK